MLPYNTQGPRFNPKYENEKEKRSEKEASVYGKETGPTTDGSVLPLNMVLFAIWSHA